MAHMLTIKSIIKSNIPLVIFHCIYAIIVAANFPFGTFFIGWDALNPELNFSLNFHRAFFPFWQENYGLGLLGGHGFAATLPHTIVTFFISFLFSTEAIRPVFTFLCLYLGGIGMYFLLKTLLAKIITDPLYVCLIGSLFYMLHLGTMQIFYVQIEPYIVHFASLPWLIWIIFRCLHEISPKNLLLFFVINFFASIQGFIPPTFFVYLSIMGIILCAYCINNKWSRAAFQRAALLTFITFAINAYWFIPFLYYQLTQSTIFLASYNNLTSTPHFIDITKKYGDIQNVSLLKSFLFDSYELGGYILQPWINHLANLWVLVIGYIFFGVSIVSLIISVTKKDWRIRALSGIFILSFLIITTNTFPFSFFNHILQTLSPTYEQALRNAFTKFGLSLTFSYTIFFSLGIAYILSILQMRIEKKSAIFFSLLLTWLIILYAFPTFQGNFLYNKLFLKIPNAYFKVIDYFQNKEDGRIADFPQDCPEGWFAYKWGYFGSGFYWYGIKQPFLARTFDVWSNNNENYYWEISQALREENYYKVDAVLDKYNARWILYDHNLTYCRSQKAIFTNQALIRYLEKSPKYSLVKTFTSPDMQPIKIYKNNNDTTKSFISLQENLPNIQPIYAWNDNDTAITGSKSYITEKERLADIFYPFRSIFTKRGKPNTDVTITNTENTIIFSKKLPPGMDSFTLGPTTYADLEKSVPVSFHIETVSPNTYALVGDMFFPEVSLDNQLLINPNRTFTLGTFTTKNVNEIKMFVNGEETTQTIFNISTTNTVQLLDDKNKTILAWISTKDDKYNALLKQTALFIVPKYTEGVLKVTIQKTTNNKYGFANMLTVNNIVPKLCNTLTPLNNNSYQKSQGFIQLLANQSSVCLILSATDIPTSNGYLLEINTRNISGNYPKFSLTNKNRTVYNDAYIYGSGEFSSYYYIVPPTFPSEIGYDMQIENTAESDIKSINDFGSIRMWYIPYNFLTKMWLSNPRPIATTKEVDSSLLTVSHPNETYYRISIDNDHLKKNATIMLSQSFDPGWKAYQVPDNTWFPFLFGKELKNHVLVNNWANGWILNNLELKTENSKLVIVFFPQYLQTFGFLLLFSTFGWFLASFIRQNLTKK